MHTCLHACMHIYDWTWLLPKMTASFKTFICSYGPFQVTVQITVVPFKSLSMLFTAPRTTKTIKPSRLVFSTVRSALTCCLPWKATPMSLWLCTLFYAHPVKWHCVGLPKAFDFCGLQRLLWSLSRTQKTSDECALLRISCCLDLTYSSDAFRFCRGHSDSRQHSIEDPNVCA